jgi:hypothetical protein
MNEECFTPGPWKIRMSGSVGTDRMMVASVYPMETEAPEENAANARLIAAAPDLLEACRLLTAYHDGNQDDGLVIMLAYDAALSAARAAIARALPQGAPDA